MLKRRKVVKWLTVVAAVLTALVAAVGGQVPLEAVDDLLVGATA